MMEGNAIHPQSLMQAAELCQAVVEEVGKVFIGNPGGAPERVRWVPSGRLRQILGPIGSMRG